MLALRNTAGPSLRASVVWDCGTLISRRCPALYVHQILSHTSEVVVTQLIVRGALVYETDQAATSASCEAVTHCLIQEMRICISIFRMCHPTKHSRPPDTTAAAA